MTNRDTSEEAKRRRAEEAANILRRLIDNPDDQTAQKDRDEFLGRGQAERRIYERIKRGLLAAKQGYRDRNRRYVFVMLGVVLASLFLAMEPLRQTHLADHRTQSAMQTVALMSGDIVMLDASSALNDNTDSDKRAVTLLAGTGFFDVQSDRRRFIVAAGKARIEALGTRFEVSHVGEDVIVSVEEGLVEVSYENTVRQLAAGYQFRSSARGSVARAIATEDVASWREDRLVLDGLTFGEAAELIGRRLAGPVIVVGGSLARDEVAGIVDLSQPENALRTLAASAGAGLIQASGYMAIIYAK